MTHGTDEVEPVQFEQVFRRADLIVQQLGEDNQYQRNDESHSEVRSHGLLLRRSIHDSGCTRFVHDLVVRCVGCLLDLSLGTLLEEEGIVVVVDVKLTLDTHHLQLFGRQGADLAVDLCHVLKDIILLYIQLRAHGAHNLIDGLLDIIHIFAVLGVVHVLLGYFATLYTEVIELLYQGGEHRFVQSHSRRSNHRTAFYIGLQILGEIVKIGLFEPESLHLLVKIFGFGEQLPCIRGHIHELVLLTEIGHCPAADIQRVFYYT